MDLFSLIVRTIGILSFILTTVGYVVAIISFITDRSNQSTVTTKPTATGSFPVVPRRRRLGMTAVIIATMSLATLAVDGTVFVLHPAVIVKSTTVAPASSYAYDFEHGAGGWVVTEQSLRTITVDTTSQPVFSGKNALRVTGQLIGDGNALYPALGPNKDAYRHIEPAVFFDHERPAGFTQPEPYDLSHNQQVSCYLYIPKAMTNAAHNTTARLFVKDTEYHNSYSSFINLDDSNVDHWFQISLVVGANSDTAFDPTKVHGMGVRFETPEASVLNFDGSFYIDACSIEK